MTLLLQTAVEALIRVGAIDRPSGDEGFAASFRAAGVPANTRSAYAGDWNKFQAWCAAPTTCRCRRPLAAVGEYVAEAAGVASISAIYGHTCAITVTILPCWPRCAGSGRRGPNHPVARNRCGWPSWSRSLRRGSGGTRRAP